MEIKKYLYCMTLVLSVAYSIPCDAQNTTYYSLCKIEEYGKVTTTCEGGQFVKVGNNVCYDVDSEGNDIGNGKLFRAVDNKTANHIYIGNSYHGKAHYIFNADYSLLTVEINPHYKYYYKKSVAPYGVYTCSLVKRGNAEGDSDIDVKLGIPVKDSQTMKINTGNNGYDNQGISSVQQTRQFKCAYCKGGYIEKNDNAPATYGTQKPRKQCHTCGKWYDPNVFVHYHQMCRHCNGTGYAK